MDERNTFTKEYLSKIKYHDYGIYLGILRLPETIQFEGLVLWSVLSDLMSLRHKIKEPIAGEIRVQWWRDCLNGANPDRGSFPLAENLCTIIQEYHLPQIAFNNLCDCAVTLLYAHPPDKLGDIQGLAGELYGTIFQSITIALASKYPKQEMTPKSYADASGYGSILMFGAWIMQKRDLDIKAGKLLIPSEILENNTTNFEDAIKSPFSEQTIHANQEFCKEVLNYEAPFKEAHNNLPSSIKCVYKPVFSALEILKKSATQLDKKPTREVTISPLRHHWAHLRSK